MVLAGIDYSYTSPAICIYNTEDILEYANLKFYNMNDRKKITGQYDAISIKIFPEYSSPEERYRNISKWASDILKDNLVEEACIEGYSFGASSGLVFNIAENASLIKQFMNLNSIKFTTPSPSQVKKNFTGKGNSKKDAMVEEFHRRFPQVVLHDLLKVKSMTKPIDDIVDSFAVLSCHEHFTKVI